MAKTALLTNAGRYTVFECGNTVLKVIAPKNLIEYKRIISWQGGIITVIANYGDEDVEEYIDIAGALRDLMYDSSVVNDISSVELG